MLFQKKLFSKGKLRSSASLTLEELYASLDDTESDFFHFLDNELTKVNDFYNEREDCTISRLSELKAQLDELAEHRKIFYVCLVRVVSSSDP